MHLQSFPQPLCASLRHVALRRSSLIVVLLALVAASLVTLVNMPRALACPVCVAPDKITLAGDGITGTASVTNPGILAWFATPNFMGFEERTPIAVPAHTGTGIEMIRYYNNTGVPASFWTQGFDHMRYYPGATGQPGYILYEGPVSAADGYTTLMKMSERTGKWFRLTADEDQQMGQLLAAAHASPQNSQASSPPSVASVPPTATQPPAILAALASIPLPIIILLACMLLLVAGVGYRLLRARRHPAPFVPIQDSAD